MNDFFRQDLDFFLNKASAKRGHIVDPDNPDETNHLNFYFLHDREELEQWIDKYLSNRSVNDIYQFNHFMNAMLKFMLGAFDSHTCFRLPDSGYPVGLVVHTDDNDSFYLDRIAGSDVTKAKIIAINNVSIDQIRLEIAQRTPHGTDGELISRTADALRKPMLLRTLPSIGGSTEVLAYHTDKGEAVIEIGKKPSHVGRATINFRPNLFADGKVVVFHYWSCSQQDMIDVTELDGMITQHNADTFILDLRWNSGGDDEAIRPLIKYLASNDLKLITLVNEDCYSSALYAIQDIGSTTSTGTAIASVR